MTTGGVTPWWKSESFKVGLALAVITGMLGIFFGWFSSDSSSRANDSRPQASTPVVATTSQTSDPATTSPAPSEAPSPTPSETTTPPAPQETEEPPASESSEPTGPVPQPDLLYLSKLDPIGGLGNWKRTGSVEMRQKTYGNSVVFAPSYFNSARLDLTYNVPSGMKYFVATVGLDDSTAPGSTVFFQVERNEGPVDSGFTMGVDGKKGVRVPVAGFQRVTIIVEVTGRGPDAVNAPLRAVWGDARFTVD